MFILLCSVTDLCIVGELIVKFRKIQGSVMKNYILGVIFSLGLTGCNQHDKVYYDGRALLQAKCVSCHNLSIPPKTFEDEKAPPMMAVAFHVKDFIKVSAPSEKKPKFLLNNRRVILCIYCIFQVNL